MIVVGLLLLGLGIADIVRASTRSLAGGIVAGAAAFTIGALVVDLAHWWAWSLAAIGAVAAWVLLTRGGSRAGQRRAAKGAVLGLAAVIVGLWLASGSLGLDIDSRVAWLWSSDSGTSLSYSTSTILLVSGIVAFLIESGNVVVRIALSSSAVTGDQDDVESVRRFLMPGEANTGGLKGGRLIGPFERLFILALVLAGEYTAIGAIVAAKGIIRFPEISRNDTNGSKAEEFLVGSFASWSLVLASVLLIAAALA